MLITEPTPIEGILHWIESRVEKVVETLSDGDQLFCRTDKLASVETICITQNMEYKRYAKVKFNYASAPWASDIECARCPCCTGHRSDVRSRQACRGSKHVSANR